MNKTKMVALLGRPLTDVEDTNFSLYLNIARERLEDITCLNLTEDTDDRVYDVRNGYSTVFTDLFTQVNSVEVNGSELTETDYSVRQWDKRNARWYNSIVLENCVDGEVTINADWGICSPELQFLLAKLFSLVGDMNNSEGNVKSKKVEDFSITFNENSVYQQFLIDNEATISKFSICAITDVQHGEVRPNLYDRRLHGDYDDRI